MVKTQYNKGTSLAHSQMNHNIKCFNYLGSRHIVCQCLNKRTIFLLESGKVSYEEESTIDSMPPLEDTSDMVHVVGGHTLVSYEHSMSKPKKTKMSSNMRTSSTLTAMLRIEFVV